ncbi:MAG: SBBP repeat-containing protein, partial [candidate division WOR-3 bacterium]
YGNDIIFNSAKIYVAGYVQFANGNKDLIVSCVDTAGQAQWIYRDTVSLEADAVVVSQSRCVYVAGFTRINSLDIIALKLDSLGNEVWRYVYDGPAGSYDEASSIVIDGNENIYVGGYSTGLGTAEDSPL